MNKKKIIIALGIVICLIIITVLLYSLITKSEIKTCEQINDELYNYVLAIKNQDLTYCGNTGNPKFCKAHVMKDTSYCDTQSDKDYCLAIITGNEKFCPAEDWWCKAEASKNIAYCDKLPKREQEQCKAEIALNEAYYKQEGLC